MSSHLCGGACCRRFTIPKPLADIQAKRDEVVVWRDSGGEMEPWMHDQVTIASMLIPLPSDDENVHWFTCVHLNAVAGLCTIYEKRPAMCRDYPSYGRGDACGHCGFAEPAEQELVQLKAAS